MPLGIQSGLAELLSVFIMILIIRSSLKKTFSQLKSRIFCIQPGTHDFSLRPLLSGQIVACRKAINGLKLED